ESRSSRGMTTAVTRKVTAATEKRKPAVSAHRSILTNERADGYSQTPGWESRHRRHNKLSSKGGFSPRGGKELSSEGGFSPPRGKELPSKGECSPCGGEKLPSRRGSSPRRPKWTKAHDRQRLRVPRRLVPRR